MILPANIIGTKISIVRTHVFDKRNVQCRYSLYYRIIGEEEDGINVLYFKKDANESTQDFKDRVVKTISVDKKFIIVNKYRDELDDL